MMRKAFFYCKTDLAAHLRTGYTTADTSVAAMAAGGTATARKGDAAAAYKTLPPPSSPSLEVSLGAILRPQL